MKLLYLSQSYVPSRRADSVQVVRMCSAFAGRGHDVELVTKLCPGRQEPGVADDHAFYGVAPSFRITKLPRPAIRGGGLRFSAAMAAHLRRRRDVDLVFSRDLWGAWRAGRIGLPVRFEAHGVPPGKLNRWLFRGLCRAPSFQGLVVITRSLLEDLRRERLFTADEVIVAPDGADPLPGDAFTPTGTPPVPLDPGRFNVGYVGHLYAGRGLDLIAALADRLPECDFHVVGGHDEAVAAHRQRYDKANLIFHGFLRPSELPRLYPWFDALLMPHQRKVGAQSGRSDISRWMSPMKLFEYMAAGKPILSSDLPVLREVLEDGRNALLLPPEEVGEWVRALRRLVADPDLAGRLGRATASDLESRYSWDIRARRVLDEL